MTEQFAFDEICRQCRAVDLDERILRPEAVVMDGVGHQFLAGSTFPANQHRGVAFAHLGDHLEHVPHFVAVPDDPGDVVFIFKLPDEAFVLFPQLLPFNPDGFQVDHVACQQRGDDAEEFFTVFKVECLIKGPVHAQGTDDLVSFFDGYAEKGDLFLTFPSPGGGSIEEKRLFADLGHSDGFSGFDNPAGDPLPQFVFSPLHGAPGEAVGHLDGNFVSQRVQNGHGTPLHIHGGGKNIQYPVKGFSQIQMFVERLADFIQQGHFFNSSHGRWFYSPVGMTKALPSL